MVTLESSFELDMPKMNYLVVWKGSFSHDARYGADADGNRGEGRWLEENLEFSVYDNEMQECTELEVLVKAEKQIEWEVTDMLTQISRKIN